MHQIPQPKEQARLLKELLAGKAIKMGYQDALEAVAVMMGFRNWQAMSAHTYAKAALLTHQEVAQLHNAKPKQLAADSPQHICWPGQPGFKAAQTQLHRGLERAGYHPCSQWFAEELEAANKIHKGYDLGPIQARIDSGEMVFSLEGEHLADISAYRFLEDRGQVELVNIGYSEDLHARDASADQGRFWYSAWRFDKAGTLVQEATVEDLFSLVEVLDHLTTCLWPD